MAIRYPSVTEIIRHQVKDSYPHDPSEYYLRRGRFLGGGKDDLTGESFQGACDILAAGEELDNATLREAAKPRRMPLSPDKVEFWADYLVAFRQFLNDKVPLTFRNLMYPAGLEVRIESERVIGHPDQIWEMEDDRREAVIDLKTGTAPKWTAIQCAMYDLAIPSHRRRRRFALELKPNKYKLIEYTETRDYDTARIWARAWWLAQDYQ